MCTFCPVGKRETLGSCVSCLVGEFNEQAGATECKKCDLKSASTIPLSFLRALRTAFGP